MNLVISFIKSMGVAVIRSQASHSTGPMTGLFGFARLLGPPRGRAAVSVEIPSDFIPQDGRKAQKKGQLLVLYLPGM